MTDTQIVWTLEVEKALLLENGFEELSGIDFEKGCYIGQEIIARIRTYGKVNRILRGLSLDGVAVEGDEIFSGDKKVGVLSSVTTEPNVALAIVHRDAIEPSTSLRVNTEKGSVTAKVATLPFERFAI